MRDLIKPETVADFWVRTGDVRRVRAVEMAHRPDSRDCCRVCRVRGGCTLWKASLLALKRMPEGS